MIVSIYSLCGAFSVICSPCLSEKPDKRGCMLAEGVRLSQGDISSERVDSADKGERFEDGVEVERGGGCVDEDEGGRVPMVTWESVFIIIGVRD